MVRFETTPTPTLGCSSSNEETSRDHIRAMCHQESTRYGPLGTTQEEAHVVDEEWRRRICEWCYSVVDHYNLKRQAVAFAMHYIDRYVVEMHRVVSTDEYQLLAVTALYVSVKVHGETEEGLRRGFPIDAFVNLSHRRFSREDLELMESRLFEKLEWNMFPPIPALFLESLRHLFPARLLEGPRNGILHEIFDDSAKFIAELTVCDSSFSALFKPSVIAYASILSAIQASPEVTKRIPLEARHEFFHQVARLTGLFPESHQVKQAQAMIAHIWEDQTPMELPIGLMEEDDSVRGSTSPVCVRAERQRAYEEASIAHIKRVHMDE